MDGRTSAVARREALGRIVVSLMPVLCGLVCYVRLGVWWALLDVGGLCGPLTGVVLFTKRLRRKNAGLSLPGLAAIFAGFVALLTGLMLCLVALLAPGVSAWWCLAVAVALGVALVAPVWPAQLRWYRAIGLLDAVRD